MGSEHLHQCKHIQVISTFHLNCNSMLCLNTLSAFLEVHPDVYTHQNLHYALVNIIGGNPRTCKCLRYMQVLRSDVAVMENEKYSFLAGSSSFIFFFCKKVVQDL